MTGILRQQALLIAASLASNEEGSRLPWLTIIAVTASVIVLAKVLRLSYHAMRRCIFCQSIAAPLKRIHSFKRERILEALADYEGRDVRPRNVMVCRSCLTAYNCTPRDYAIVGASRLEKEEAIAAGVKLQIDDFCCHKCGDTLAESDSGSLSDSDRKLVASATSNANSPDLSLRLYCVGCKTVHLWVPLAGTDYKFLRAVPQPDGP